MVRSRNIVEPTRLIVWSDYLCPWCYNGTVRMRRLEEEFGDELVVEWRSFLLRPHPQEGTSLEKFRAYTQSWLRPAADEPAGSFRVWESTDGPPSHSVPPHLVAKAAAELGPEAFREIHDRLLHAYFAENRDITRDDTLRAVWREAGLPDAELARSRREDIRERVLAEHEASLRAGVTGVPAVMMEGTDAPLVGALPLETYRRWIRKVRAAPATEDARS